MMAWVRINDDLFQHRKVFPLTPEAKLVYIASITQANQQRTDGFLTRRMVSLIIRLVNIDNDPTDELVEAQLWLPTSDGWWIHDYLDYQPSAAAITARREGDAERQRRHRGRHGVTNGVTNDVTQEHSMVLSKAIYQRPVNELLPGERMEVERAGAELSEAGREPAEIEKAVAAWRTHWPTMTLTPSGLVRRFTTVMTLAETKEKANRGPSDQDQRASERRAAKGAALAKHGILPDAD